MSLRCQRRHPAATHGRAYIRPGIVVARIDAGRDYRGRHSARFVQKRNDFKESCRKGEERRERNHTPRHDPTVLQRRSAESMTNRCWRVAPWVEQAAALQFHPSSKPGSDEVRRLCTVALRMNSCNQMGERARGPEFMLGPRKRRGRSPCRTAQSTVCWISAGQPISTWVTSRLC